MTDVRLPIEPYSLPTFELEPRATARPRATSQIDIASAGFVLHARDAVVARRVWPLDLLDELATRFPGAHVRSTNADVTMTLSGHCSSESQRKMATDSLRCAPCLASASRTSSPCSSASGPMRWRSARIPSAWVRCTRTRARGSPSVPPITSSASQGRSGWRRTSRMRVSRRSTGRASRRVASACLQASRTCDTIAGDIGRKSAGTAPAGRTAKRRPSSGRCRCRRRAARRACARAPSPS